METLSELINRYPALTSCEKLIDKCSDACAEDRRGDLRGQTDDRGNCDGCREDRENLLEREDEHVAKPRLVVDVVN